MYDSPEQARRFGKKSGSRPHASNPLEAKILAKMEEARRLKTSVQIGGSMRNDPPK